MGSGGSCPWLLLAPSQMGGRGLPVCPASLIPVASSCSWGLGTISLLTLTCLSFGLPAPLDVSSCCPGKGNQQVRLRSSYPILPSQPRCDHVTGTVCSLGRRRKRWKLGRAHERLRFPRGQLGRVSRSTEPRCKASWLHPPEPRITTSGHPRACDSSAVNG